MEQSEIQNQIEQVKIDVRNSLTDFMDKTGLQIHRIDIDFVDFGSRLGPDIVPQNIQVHIKG